MKIFSIRKGFQADHSSTSYEFLAIDKPLNNSQRKKVASLSSRARPTKRRVSFIYHGEWNDLPGGWEPLMGNYYDVMYSESYDWWTLVMAFKAQTKAIKEIKKYEFSGIDNMGVTVEFQGKRVIVSIYCHLDPGMGFDDSYNDYDDYDDYDDDDDLDEAVESNNFLLNLLTQNRKYLKSGDYRLLYGVWQKYGFELDDDEEFKDEDFPAEPSGMNKLPRPIESLLSLLFE